MATISLSLSAKVDKTTGKSEILIRFVVGSRINQRGKSNIFIEASYWNANEGRIVIPKFRLMNDEQKQLVSELIAADKQLANLQECIMQAFNEAGAGKTELAKDWLKSTIIDYYAFPTKAEDEAEAAPQKSFLEVFADFIDSEDKDISEGNRLHYKALWRLLKRYEIIKGTTLDFETLSPDTIRDIQKYMRNEYRVFQNPSSLTKKAFTAAPESRKPKERGENTVIILTKKLRAFVRWANGLDREYKLKEPYTHNNPFDSLSIGSEQYGTPYYLTLDERNQLLEAELPERLAKQRDIFVFQCLIGCRISDLWGMTKDNIVDGAIEYVPQKTQRERSTRVRVPLNSKAMEILERYKDCGNKLLPFVAQQQYNEDIKEMLKLAGIDRAVTVRNSLTGKAEQHPIYEVASSHMARRTFVGNLYKQVKDPNLIGSLSGHVEGSRAFVRYRNIDEETKKELVSMLD